MRPRILAVAGLAAACSQFPFGTVPAVSRPAREHLAIGGATLASRPMATAEEDGWLRRRTTRVATAPPDSAEAVAAEPEELVPGTATEKESAFDSNAWNSAVGVGGGAGGRYGGRAAAGKAATGGPAAGERTNLRAGATDDNAAFADYLAFLADARADLALTGRFVDLDVADRAMLRVVDKGGQPMPGTAVAIVDQAKDAVVWRGTTYGDGAVPFHPALATGGRGDAPMFFVEVPLGDRLVRHMWNGKADTVVRLPAARPAPALQLDVAFVIDTTGSMGDEIAAIQATLLQVTARLRDLGKEFDLRYGAVLYRDLGDDYVTAQRDFTGDIAAFDALLKGVKAGGGGDTPESLNQGLAVAVDGLSWRDGAAKVVFLIADAPPHLDYANDVPYDQSLAAAVARGIRIHTVAASGLDRAGSVVFRQIAQFTRGEFVFLEYGGDLQASAEAHGVKNATGNNLDDILFTRIRDEIARWGRPPA